MVSWESVRWPRGGGSPCRSLGITDPLSSRCHLDHYKWLSRSLSVLIFVWPTQAERRTLIRTEFPMEASPVKQTSNMRKELVYEDGLVDGLELRIGDSNLPVCKCDHRYRAIRREVCEYHGSQCNKHETGVCPEF